MNMRDLMKLCEARYSPPKPLDGGPKIDDNNQYGSSARRPMLLSLPASQPQSAYLFHGAPLDHLVSILRDNCISTGINWRGEGERVACTRNWKIALGFGNQGDFDMFPAFLVLDWAKLAKKYHIVSYEDCDMHGEAWKTSEQEEAVCGEITPLSSYLISINVAPEVLLAAMQDREYADWVVGEKSFFSSPRYWFAALQRLSQSPKLNAWRP
jgi:hypothetical protein